MDKSTIDYYRNVLVDLGYSYIRKLKLGIITDNCQFTTLPILINCLENFDILTEDQQTKILDYLN